VNRERDELLGLAGRRTEWAARALAAAGDELLRAGEDGALVNGTAEALLTESERVGVLVRRIAADRRLTGTHRRARDSL
jgi:hypothetical protein